jgi:transcriptional regulator with GAF, ATPase, and Fis domain
MKNLNDAFSLQNVGAISLDALTSRVLAFSKADFIQLFFDHLHGKDHQGSVHKFSNDEPLTDLPERNIEFLSTGILEDLPVVHSAESEITNKKGATLNIKPFQQLIHLPLNDGPHKIILTLAFMQIADSTEEMINDLLIRRNIICNAIARHKEDSMVAEKKFLLSFSAILSAVKTTGQLSRAINFHLRKYLHFKHATLFVFNTEQDAVFDYLRGVETEGWENPFYKMIRLNKDGPPSFDFDEISETHDISPYLDPYKAPPGTTGLVANLYQGEVVMAHLVLLFEGKFIANHGSMQVVTNLLSTTLLRLRCEERGAEREAELDILQSLNVDFASIRDKDDLLKIIQFKLKKLLEFGHHWVAVTNEDQQTMTCFLQEETSNSKNHPHYRNMTAAKYSTNDRILNRVLLSKEPQIFDLDQLHTRTHLPEYLTILYEGGVKKVVMMGLQVSARIIGVWAICLNDYQEMSMKQLNLIKGISSQLSIAVDNIIANMAIMRKEAEREKLLEFSFSLTSIRNRSHLVKVIKNSLKKVISFADLVILISHENNSGNSIFLSTTELPSDVETPATILATDIFVDRIFQSEGAVVFNEEKLTPECDKTMICIGLRENDYRMCLLFLTTTAMHHYTAHELDLIKAISYQLSPAIANILANEDIDRREKEKELLLALNIDIAAARSQDELLQVITQRLKSFIEFSYMMIIKIDSCLIEDPIFSKVLPHSQPKVFDLQQMDHDSTLPAYFLADFANGARQVVIVRLSKGIQVYGCWSLYFPGDTNISAGNLELLESIANQISIAVTNIIANMEIAQREQEKARLLSFSNAIASVRDKNILAKILKQQLKDLFDITDYVIHALSDNKQTYTPILFDLDANFAQQPDFRKLINAQNNVNDGIFDRILASEDPVFFDKRMIGVSIRLGQENIAFITFIHDDYTRITEQYHLFKCILSQIALTVSNIVANEKVNRQLEEINKNKHHLEEEKIYLKEEIETTLNYGEIVGESPVMQKTFRLVAQVAPSDSTVLILGETGTGKELIARAIHNNSPRKNKLMVKVNCAALPANLIESELFGHERGSFTGATDRRLGKFELANNGTLFLDEIGEMPLDLQVKLLRALQEREIERVGGNTTIKVNVRVIAATNRDLETEMQEGRFRGDLYYRLNIFPIELPPLRHRKEDIPLLASYFINRFAKKAGKEILTLSTGALQEMIQYRWPGNIRELEHLIERSVLLASGDTIRQVHLPAGKQHNVKAEEAEFVIKTIDEHEREFILKTLKYCNGRIAGKGGAAILLGVPTSTLNSKIKRLGIRKEHIPR